MLIDIGVVRQAAEEEEAAMRAKAEVLLTPSEEKEFDRWAKELDEVEDEDDLYPDDEDQDEPPDPGPTMCRVCGEEKGGGCACLHFSDKEDATCVDCGKFLNMCICTPEDEGE